jgi:hypothetical protein
VRTTPHPGHFSPLWNASDLGLRFVVLIVVSFFASVG